MEKFTKRAKRIRLVFVAATAIMCMLMLLGFSGLGRIFQYDFKHNYYTVYVDGVKIGSSTDYEQIQDCIKEARKKINDESTELSYVEADIMVKTSKRIVGASMSHENMVDGIYQSLCSDVDDSKNEAYVVDIDGYVLTMTSLSDVEYLFTTIREKYDHSNKFSTNLYISELSGHTTISCDVLKADVQALDIPTVWASMEGKNKKDGIDEVSENRVTNVSFGEKVEIVPCYVNNEEIEELNNVIDKVEENKGDSELSVLVNERQTYDVEYGVDVEYVYNENLYNTEQKVVREGNNGVKRIVADITYKNGEEVYRDIVSETILKDAVSKVIEVGTAIPPTYVKPIYGGTLSSTFGERWGTIHKGVDWACSTGTNVMASCDGKVIQAGWINGYGYCVTLQHSDGKCTRYGHLSEVLVSEGQRVSQKEVIGLSGNTGNSTGPHVHFEIIVDGVQENPFNYLN